MLYPTELRGMGFDQYIIALKTCIGCGFSNFRGPMERLQSRCMVLCPTIMASTLAEWLFGRRGLLLVHGPRMVSTVLRYTATRLFCLTGLLVAFCAGHHLERGKKAFQDSFEPQKDRPTVEPPRARLSL